MGGMADTSDGTARHLRKLAALVTQRRIALGITDKRVAATRCGLSVTTYSRVETREERVTDSTYAKLEAGFGFRPGSCRAVLGGADSITLLDGTELVAGMQIVRGQVSAGEVADGLTEELREGVLDLATGIIPHVPLGEAQEMSKRVAEYALKVLRKRGIIEDSE
jgi:transcriptional regulator with XRE-family HTH domain